MPSVRQTHGDGAGVNDIEEIAKKIAKLMQIQPPKSVQRKNSAAGELIKLAGVPPKIVSDGACQEVIHREPDLNILPVLNLLAGRRRAVHHFADGFFERSCQGTRNVGLYRMQVFDRAHHRACTGTCTKSARATSSTEGSPSAKWNWRFALAAIRR